jgi:hypothetical protein
VPGIAVCWNFLPKYYGHSIFFDGSKSEQQNTESHPLQPKKIITKNELSNENSATAELPVFFGIETNNPVENNTVENNTAEIKTAAGNVNDKTSEINIPAAFVPSPAEWASAVASNAEVNNIHTDTAVSPAEQRQDYPNLEKELNRLGAKYYRLEKWGRQGDLFRFSCYVSPNSGASYQKYFQAIDSDEIRVMQRVADEIKQWKQSGAGY